MILSLYDYSGVWSAPWARDYRVLRVDTGLPPGLSMNANELRFGGDVTGPLWHEHVLVPVTGVLAAPPCRCFCKPGARLWNRWDSSGETEHALRMVDAVLDAVERYRPLWWALENPPGRLANKKGTGLRQHELGAPAFTFHPYQFAGWADDPASEAHTKYTCLWGRFQPPVARPVEPEPYPDHLPPGRRDRTSRVSSSWKRARQRTPSGFARAFYEANKGVRT